MHLKNYLKYLTIFTLVVLFFIGGFNWFMDPFDIFLSPRIEGINKLKPEFQNHVRLAKAYAVKNIKPQAIVLGTSRAEVGIDPDHSGWSYQPVYNLGLSGANIYEIYRYFQDAENIRPLKQVLLQLDFFSFSTDMQNQPDFDENRLTVNADGQPNPTIYINDIRSSLLSLDAIQSSIITTKQKSVNRYYLPNGFRQYTSLFVNNGYHALFSASEHDAIASYNPKRFLFTNPVSDSAPFTYYRKILEMAYQEGIDMRLVIAPYHARQTELIAAGGTWTQSEDWKRNLAIINEAEALKYGQRPFPLWDFSGYNEFTTETVPAPGDTHTQMQWYWDGSHFKKELGDLMLKKIFNYPDAKQNIPDDFGILINSQNIEQHVENIRNARQVYRDTHPNDILEIEKVFQQPK